MEQNLGIHVYQSILKECHESICNFVMYAKTIIELR